MSSCPYVLPYKTDMVALNIDDMVAKSADGYAVHKEKRAFLDGKLSFNRSLSMLAGFLLHILQK